ncbi:alpha/beta fold hydrolase [Actinokineospora sp. PR83]|uniref:alpha/beta fold hydrolase n=1 Tax=Actinokineospora sp. PR83 TaxID=2884908 RepID=UPI0027E0B43B|nr:alpha/beta fold hydrolase [Actinokineospora sp. PR83]MCG8914188.1 alpha/beta fold hydrolase [Actinokineospora sp. PR83]
MTRTTGGGLSLLERGEPGRPAVVFLHGWAQTGEVWADAVDALADEFHLLVPDLRGHGRSAGVDGPFDDGRVWADDVAAVLALARGPVTLVGWSYGGLVITDYLRHRGCADLRGIVLVGALTEIGRGNPGGAVGPAMRAALPDALSPDDAVAEPAIRALTAAMTAEPAAPEVVERGVATALRTPAHVRRGLFTRSVSSGDVLAGVTVPTLVLHGDQDAVVTPAAAEYALGKIPGASARWFTRVGHMPFAERAAEFTHAVRSHAGGRKE